MKWIVFILIVMYATSSYAGIDPTQEQFENLDIIHRELLKTHPTFKGLHGTRHDICATGISVPDLKVAVDAMDIPSLITNDPEKKKKKDTINKLKGLGLTKEEIDLFLQ